MKKIKIEEAIGKELCHDITAMYNGFKGAIFKRGHIIEESDVSKLLEIGKEHIYIWEENDYDIHEEDAAIRLSNMTNVDNAHYTDVSEGKILLIADTEGMFVVDKNLLDKINMIGDITIATIPNHYHVHKGDRLASMRIVPLFTKEEQIIEAENLCKNKKLYDLITFKYKKIGVVITGSEVYNNRIKDKFEPVCREKLSKYPCDILSVVKCDDNIQMIEDSINNQIDNGANFIICTGGMSVDPDDVTPIAIKNIGADIISHGVPAQPGNMTLVAYKNDIPIIGVPGAAISLPTTIFDVLLPQIFSDIKFSKKDLINLGSSGLCQMCKVCHYPNCTFGKY